MEARIARLPRFDLRMLVGGEVVTYDVEMRSFVPPGSNTSIAPPEPTALEWSIFAGTSDNNAGWSDLGEGSAP